MANVKIIDCDKLFPINKKVFIVTEEIERFLNTICNISSYVGKIPDSLKKELWNYILLNNDEDYYPLFENWDEFECIHVLKLDTDKGKTYQDTDVFWYEIKSNNPIGEVKDVFSRYFGYSFPYEDYIYEVKGVGIKDE